MYFPSDSWGKFNIGGEFEEDNININEIMIYINNMAISKELTQKMLKSSSTFNDSFVKNLTLYKKILEVITMPVYNPKTEEEDYVEIDLVNKIMIDPTYLQSMTSKQRSKISFSLNGKDQTISLHATCQEIDMYKIREIPLQEFEEMLFKAINEQKDQRLEEVKEFQDITRSMLDEFIDSQRPTNLFARLNKVYELEKGIGIIRDVKANQEIGTFESLTYHYQDNKQQVNFYNLILIGRDTEDLKEKDRFEFLYHSLDTGMSYSFMSDSQSKMSYKDNDYFEMNGFLLQADEFNEKSPHYQTVITAEEKRSLMSGIDQDHPLYSTNYNEFRKSRLAMIEESRNKARKEKLINQFADIDLDL